MSTPVQLAHTTILLPLSSSTKEADEIPQLPAISLLPFSINYDGPARVSTYFHPSPVPSTSASATDDEHRQQAAFRGRLLLSRRVPLPEGYSGLVFSTSTPAPAPVKNEAQAEEEERKAKRARLDATREKERTAAVARGLRRSPRKVVRKEVQRFSLDSDDEEEEGAEGMKEEGSEATLVAVEEQPQEMKELGDLPTSLDPIPVPAARTPSPEPAGTIAEEEASTEQELGRDIRYLKPTHTFSSLDIWHADHAGELGDDVYARGMSEWIGLSAKVNRRVTPGCAPELTRW